MKSNHYYINQIRQYVKLLNGTERYSDNHTLLMKEPVKVGELNGKDILCTYVSSDFNSYWKYSQFYINVIFNQRASDIYEREYDFHFVSYMGLEHRDSNKPEIVNQKEEDYNEFDYMPINSIYQNALELVLNALKSWGNEWIDEVRTKSKRRLWLTRTAINNDRKWTFEENKERYELSIWSEKIHYNRIDLNAQRELKEMEKLGKEQYLIKKEIDAEKMRKIMDEIMAEKDWECLKK